MRKATKFSALILSWLFAMGAACAQELGQSDWQQPSSSPSSLGQSQWQQPSSSPSSLGQSQWQQPSSSPSPLGQSQWQQPSSSPSPLGQSQWQQPSSSPSSLGQSQWQQPSSSPSPLGQSQWQQPSSSPSSLGQSQWQQPSSSPSSLGQSQWQQPAGQGSDQNLSRTAAPPLLQPKDLQAVEMRAKPPQLTGSATTTKTLGDALEQEQQSVRSTGAVFNQDIDPAAAAMFMNQIKGNSGTTRGASPTPSAVNPAAALMNAMTGSGGDEELNALSKQMAPALNAIMQIMPASMGPGQSAVTSGIGLPKFGQYAPRPVIQKTNNPIGGILPTNTVRNLLQNAAYQGMSHALNH